MIKNIILFIFYNSLCLLGASVAIAFVDLTSSKGPSERRLYTFALAASLTAVFNGFISFTTSESRPSSAPTSPRFSAAQQRIAGSTLKPARDTSLGVIPAAGSSPPLPTPLPAPDTMSEQQVVPFVRRSDATTNMEIEISPPTAQVEMPNWLLVIYNQLEGELGRMERFIRETQQHNQSAVDVLPSLVREYQSLLRAQNQLFDQAVENDNQLLHLSQQQFSLIELKSQSFAQHVNSALSLITTSASDEFEKLRSSLENQIHQTIRIHTYTEELQRASEVAFIRHNEELTTLNLRSARLEQHNESSN